MSYPSCWPVAIAIGALLAGTPPPALATPLPMHGVLSAAADVEGRAHRPPVVIGSGDFNGDGIGDVVETTSRKGSGEHLLTVLLGHADGSFTRVDSENTIGSHPSALVVGDFNGDGKADVIVGDRDGTVVEFRGDGRGDLVPAGTVASLGSVASIAQGRFTKSGHLDLVISDTRANSGVVLLGNGDGSFRRVWSFRLPKIGVEFHIATADFNQDGIADLMVSSDEDDDYEVMLGSGIGTFAYSAKFSRVRDPNSYCPT